MLCDAYTAVWGRELDNGGTSVAKVPLAKTSLKHSCSPYSRYLNNKIQGSDSEVESPPASESDEE